MNKYKDGPEKQDLITSKLKALYNSVQEEDIPDRFLQMLEQLDEAEAASKLSSQDRSDGK